jgi:hypothetical protein
MVDVLSVPWGLMLFEVVIFHVSYVKLYRLLS